MCKEFFYKSILLLFAGLSLIVGTSIAAYGQFRIAPIKTIGNSITCHVGNETYNLTPDKKLIAGINAAPNDEEAQEVFDKVSRHTELIGNIYTVPVVDNINVQICPGTVNYIAYNGDWVETLYAETNNPWVLYAIIAHEIGHYVKAHDRTSLGSNPKIELEADEYAGEILAKMGACLQDAEAAYRSKIMGKNQASHTHPPINERLEAVKRGWERFGKCPVPVNNVDGSNKQFVIDTPLKGETVGITTMVRGKTPYPRLNHYIVVISLQAQRYFIQQPIRMLSNGNWEGFAAFGTQSYGVGDQWSIRVFATSSSLSVGEIFNFPKDAVFSNEVIVTRNR
jgi:hypothetical protein